MFMHSFYSVVDRWCNG